MFHCHCSVCRKHHGTLHATTVVGQIDTFQWRAGADRIGTWASSAQELRSFCVVCGSKLPRLEHDSRRVFMAAGTLEGDIGIRPQMHLFAGSMPAWQRITDELPRYDAYPPGSTAPSLDIAPRPVREGVTAGSCACGRVSFELEGQALMMMHCHCSRCRRARGTAHASNIGWNLDALRFTAGEELLTVFDLPGAQHFGTTFCSHCGGFAPRRSPGRGIVIVPIGVLDSDPKIQPTAHIFVSSKASWHDIADDVPQLPEAAPRPWIRS
jgi:hypothetical protein